MIPPIYIINYNNDERRNKMIQRFSNLNIEPYFVPGVHINDKRLKCLPHNADKRTCSIMLQHLDAIKHFYEQSSCEHCIVCEDDIHISKDFNDITQIIPIFDSLKLDCLLLGYLLPYKIDINNPNQMFRQIAQHLHPKFTFHQYPDILWGSQMYMISRKYAKYLIDTYSIQYAIQNPSKPYSPDWIITKIGYRSLIYPMLAVEEGNNSSTNQLQYNFHKTVYRVHYDINKYI